MKAKKTNSRRKKAVKRPSLSYRYNKKAKDFKSLIQQNTVSDVPTKEPYELVMEIFTSLTPSAQNTLLRQINHTICGMRLKELEKAELTLKLHQEYVDDFDKQVPGITTYKRTTV
jgi:hypothetical protein